MKLFFITSRFPYPPIKGDKLRPYHFIKYLSNHHEILLASVISHKSEYAYIDKLRPYCQKIITHLLPLHNSLLISSSHFLSKDPLQSYFYFSNTFKDTIKSNINTYKPDLIFIELIRSIRYLDLEDFKKYPVVVDFVDAIGKNYRNEWNTHKNVISFMKLCEGKKVTSYEQNILTKIQQGFITTDEDKKELSDNNDKLSVIPVGLDLSKYPFLPNRQPSNKIIFTGNMSYSPNIDAAVFFATKIFPRIKNAFPQAEFHIAGASPNRKIIALAKRKAIYVHGKVDSIHKFMNTGCIYVCYMRYGAGIKIKLLEAMANGIPIITTSNALEGIWSSDNTHAWIADNPEEFSDICINLLNNSSNRNRTIYKARSFVEQHFDWNIILKRLEMLLLEIINKHKNK